MIRSSVLRCGVRREEEIGARLSNECIYELYCFSRQSRNRHVSHAFLHGHAAGKKKAPLEGRAGPKA
jgi:hypothetical protein